MDYRKFYKEHYAIEFGSDFVVHHIDSNRNNNDISNLLLLPRKLHARYHFLLNALSIQSGGYVDLKLKDKGITNYELKILDLLPEIMKECNKWIRYKENRYEIGGFKMLRGE